MNSKLSVSFVMPMFNERENISGTICQIRSIAEGFIEDYEIVVVDDASTDGCGDIVEEMARDDARIKLFRLKANTKFGGAFAKAFKSAAKDIILYMDSDMPVDADDIKKSIPLIGEADIVSGYSKVKKGETLLRKVISGIYNLMVQSLFGLNVRDINSGYKIVRRDLIEGMEFVSRSPFIDVELFIQARRKNRTVVQYPLVFRERTGGKSHIASVPIILATFRDMIKLSFIASGGKL
jgi:glycosyltransferase involved in cell wall biosynthesis